MKQMSGYAGEPMVRVGIMEGNHVEYQLHGRYARERGGSYFRALTPESRFELKDVTIGVNFHWQRKENQQFAGNLSLEPNPSLPGVTMAINEVGVEEYLKSVISSEMNAHASEALLTAHAVMSRSWLLRQIADKGQKDGDVESHGVVMVDGVGEVEELIRWYDREGHPYFDVCADDHCQRYQGVTRQTTTAVAHAVEATRGMVLTYGGEIADARFHKCCGGTTEVFASCWESHNVPYLRSIADVDDRHKTPFCDTSNLGVLQQVLNDYDRENHEFYRWSVTYTSGELAAIIRRRSGFDFGEIEELRPLERGASGRIVRLLVRGSRRSMVVGKELEIRRWLSPSHLRSSWFDIEHTSSGAWTLRGRGWGHGAGLCQIGAAVMGAEGYTWREILSHYFPGTEIKTLY